MIVICYFEQLVFNSNGILEMVNLISALIYCNVTLSTSCFVFISVLLTKLWRNQKKDFCFMYFH